MESLGPAGVVTDVKRGCCYRYYVCNSRETVMTTDEFLVHACEQVLRFTRVHRWDDLSEERKVQLGFNMGVMAFGLNLSKEDGYQVLANAREGRLSMAQFREHAASLIRSRNIVVDETKVARPIGGH